MDAEKLAQLEENFATFRDMIAEIFGVSGGEETLSFSNPSELLIVFSNRIIMAFNNFTKTEAYSFFVGLTLIGVMIHALIQIYEENNALRRMDFRSTRMIKKYFIVGLVFVVIYLLPGIVYYILALFRYIVYFVLGVTDADTSIVSLDGILDANALAYNILDKEKIFDGSALIDITLARTKEADLRNLYFVPWVLAWISKMGLVVIVMINSIKILVYSSLYVVSLSDIILGLKNSRFVNYTKNLIALALQQTVIILIIYFSRVLCNPYLYKLLTDVMAASGNFLGIAMAFVAVRCSELVLLILSNQISKRTLGVK